MKEPSKFQLKEPKFKYSYSKGSSNMFLNRFKSITDTRSNSRKSYTKFY